MCLGNTFFKVDSSVCEKALNKGRDVEGMTGKMERNV